MSGDLRNSYYRKRNQIQKYLHRSDNSTYAVHLNQLRYKCYRDHLLRRHLLSVRRPALSSSAYRTESPYSAALSPRSGQSSIRIRNWIHKQFCRLSSEILSPYRLYHKLLQAVPRNQPHAAGKNCHPIQADPSRQTAASL